MGDATCCVICQSSTSNDDIFRKHLNDVLKPIPYHRNREEKEIVSFENTQEQVLIKYPREVRSASVTYYRRLPLKQYHMEFDLPELKPLLDRNEPHLRSQSGRAELILKNIGRENLHYLLKKGSSVDTLDYVNGFKILLWIEEHHARKERQMHNERGVKLTFGQKDKDGSPLYGVDVLGFSDGRPPLIMNDHVRIHKENDRFVDEITRLEKYRVYESRVKDIKKNQDKIYVAPHPHKFQYRHNEAVGVEYVLNRRPYQLCHRALEQVEKNPALRQTLFPQKPERIELIKDLEFINRKILNDAKQSLAVRCIISGTSGLAPYVLIGPPGTGKTATLVEAIYQIWKRSAAILELPKICICAPSNTAIDVIVKRLLGRDGLEDDCPPPPTYLRGNVMRVYANDGVRDKHLLDCSTNEVDPDVLMGKHIIATTTWTAGWLLDNGFGRNWFDYLFIDEAGQATEPDILVPIAGFMHDECHLVLAGDPKQLGPVVASPIARALKLDVSFMERLHSLPIYRNIHNRYSYLLTTILDNNYRSHPQIIRIPNIKFYDGHLKAVGDSGRINLASNSDWEELGKYKNQSYPIIFHGVKGKQVRDGNSPSYFNVEEIIEVKNYIEKLLGRVLSGDKPIEQENIGIICPYRNQVEKINKYLNHRNWNGIRAGSVESFQGSEKPIIIISTVISDQLGFVKNERRFNVAVTRAIALLIVIGHPDVLYTQGSEQYPNHWKELIQECYKKGACKGRLPLKRIQKY